MNDFLMAKITFHCDIIQKGKPCSCEPIQDRYVNEAINIIKNENLQSYIEELSEGWKTVWIYKDDYMLDVIKQLPNNPKSTFEHWILGKAFGYSDESIKNFIISKTN